MFAVDRATLNVCLEKNAKEQAMVPFAMERMEPFFLRAEAGKYDLRKGSAELAVHAKNAIAISTGTKVHKVILVSQADMLPMKPEWMSQDVYDKSLQASIGISIGTSLQASIGTNLGNRLWTNLGNRLWTSIGTSLWNTLWTSLGTSLGNRLGTSLGNRLGNRLWTSIGTSIGTSLFYYLGSTLVDDQKKVDRLISLIELLPHAIPLGEKKDEPGTWLVLVA